MRKLHLFSILAALSLATTNLWALPTGALPGTFTINNSCDMVYFSKGNLQYIGSAETPYWKFADHQYDYLGTSQSGSAAENIDRDLFGWATSGNPASGTRFQPWEIDKTNGADYGPAISSGEWNSENSDWGKNMGNDWRTLTHDEWCYVISNRSGANYLRTFATIHGVRGLILLPDGWTVAGSEISSLEISIYDKNVSDDDWTILESEGAVFLPTAGIYRPDGVAFDGVYGHYWSSTAANATNAYLLMIASGTLAPNSILTRYYGFSVRLVQNLTTEEKKASVTSAPTANSLTYIKNTDQALVTAGTAQHGTLKYRLGDTGDFTTTIPTATNAGEYTVQYFVDGTGCFDDTDVAFRNVTIAQADYTPSGSYSVTGNAVSYTGSAKVLAPLTGAVTDGTVWYKLGDGSWSTSIPTATDIGDYHVWYKVVPDDSNYKTTEPVEVLASITIPTITDHSDAATINAVLALNPTALRVERTIYADGEYNTICLPFDVSASELTTSTHPLYGYERLKAFKGAKVSGSGQDLSIDIFVEDVDHMDAGVPYLITYPAGNADIVNPVFQDITVTTTTPDAVSADGVTFQGMFAQVHINPYETSREQDYLFLGTNSQLNWPLASETDESVKMRGFRAYFIIDRTVITPAAAPSGTRARFVNAPKQPTSIENTELNTQAQKFLENGQLIILKNGIKYNAQGQVLK